MTTSATERLLICGVELAGPVSSEARWAEFKQDIGFFVNKLGGRWADSQKDHGYNGTPWWSIGGSLLANAIGPLTDFKLEMLARIDQVLIVAAFGFIWWAFGLEIFAVAASFFAVNFPSRFYWNGGAFLRYDYLAFAIIGICLVGNFDKTAPSATQLQSLSTLVRTLMKRCNISASNVKTHQQINVIGTRCPGSRFPTKSFLAGLKS